MASRSIDASKERTENDLGYFDESGLHDRKTGRLLSLTLGGGLARAEAWDELSAGWEAALRVAGVTMFHMKDFAAFRGEFKDWKEEDRKWLLNELLGLIIQHISDWIGFVSRPEDANGKTRAVYGKIIVDSMVLLASDAGHRAEFHPRRMW